MQWGHLCVLEEHVGSVNTVAARVMAYIHPEVVEAMGCKDEVDACADAVSKCCPWTWGRVNRITGSRLRETRGGMGRP